MSGSCRFRGAQILSLSSPSSVRSEETTPVSDLMAQITSQGRLKLHFKGNNGGPSDSRNPLQYKLSFNGGLLRLVAACSPGFQRPRPRRFALRVLASSSAHNTNRRSTAGEHYRDRDSDDYDDEEFGEFDNDELSCFRGLVLDIAYRPVNVVCWKRAICLEFMEKADVLEYYDQTVNSPSGSFYIPAVLRVPHLLQVVKRKRIRNTLSRKNVFYRDDYTCQYCSSVSDLTIDHVMPVARGGKWAWENLVTACAKCNCKKGHKTPEEANMTLARAPKAPKEFDILAIPLTAEAIRMLRRKGTPIEWRQYLPMSALDS